MPIRMIVTDLDGTLLRTDKTISERTKTALGRCREAGVKIVYATGRGGTAQRVAPSAMFDGRITMNGAVAKVGDDTVYSRLIPYTTARPVLMACNERGMKVTSEISGMHYSNFAVSDMWPVITNFELVDFSRHEMDAEKLYTPNPSSEDRAFIENLLPDDLYFLVTSDGSSFFGQIMHKEATKGKAVATLAQLWGISGSEIVAFGDDLNDLDMLAFAGVGVAMGNAVDEAKAVADQVCKRNDEDGLAEWIELNVMGQTYP